jgi:hypothetical protein
MPAVVSATETRYNGDCDYAASDQVNRTCPAGLSIPLNEKAYQPRRALRLRPTEARGCFALYLRNTFANSSLTPPVLARLWPGCASGVRSDYVREGPDNEYSRDGRLSTRSNGRIGEEILNIDRPRQLFDGNKPVNTD